MTDPDVQITITGYSYDANGNVLADGNHAYVWDWDNRLISSNTTKSNAETYVYNPEGLRVQQSTSATTTNHTIDPDSGYGDVIEERDQNGNLQVRYDYGDDLLRLDRNSGLYYYIYDGLGSTRQLVDGSGILDNNDSYDAFGNLLTGVTTTNVPNSYLYDGQESDPSGLYYLRARYMNPATGVFLSQDPDTQNVNPYIYASAEPVDRVDPGGMDDNLAGTTASTGIAATIQGWVVGAFTAVRGFATSRAVTIVAFEAYNTAANLYMASSDPESFGANQATLGFGNDVEAPMAFFRSVGTRTRLILDDMGPVAQKILKWGSSNSTKLAQNLENLGILRPLGYQAHHIISGTKTGITEIDEARETMMSYGIDVNDAANGMFLPTGVHWGKHWEEYHKMIGQYISESSGKEDCVARLQTAGEMIQQKMIALNQPK